MKRLTAVLLTVGIILAIVADSTDFFFHRPYYEYWDLGASSLCVDRAKHFAQLYGSYSRFGWHHPGPIFFYVWAFGEWLFYDLLHLTPAPFNAQTLINLFVTTGFFVAALNVFTQWVSASARKWFLMGALVLGALHFGAVPRMPSYDMLLGCSVFTSAWTAHTWVLPFLCILAAGASVAAGRGKDLPLLAMADGFLIHSHIAAPLFVGPLTLMAYAGLLVKTNASERARVVDGQTSSPLWRRPLRTLGAAWRAYPQAHIVAVAILAFFALPLVIDLFRGDASNFHAILTHLRTYHGKHKTFKRSLFYFLQFGAYRAYKPHDHHFEYFDTRGAYEYLWHYKNFYAAWLCGLLLVIWTSVIRPILVFSGRWTDDQTAAPRRTAFLAWGGGFLASSIVLTLYWGIMQDGDMMYYSAWINFAIYYFGLLIVVAEFASVLAADVSRWKGGTVAASKGWRWAERLVPVAVVLLAFGMEARRFRVCDPTPEMTAAMHESVVRIVQDAKARNPDGIKVLDMPIYAWPCVTGLALEMEREGQPFLVLSAYPVAFPPSLWWRPTSMAMQEKMEVWHILMGRQFTLWVSGTPKWFVSFQELLKEQLAAAKQAGQPADGTLTYPLLNDIQLHIDIPCVDPGKPEGDCVDMRLNHGDPPDKPYTYEKHPELSFAWRHAGTCPGCAMYGFSQPESWGSWNDGPRAMLRMRGKPVDPTEDVQIGFVVHPFLAPSAHLTSQRLSVALNGTSLGDIANLDHDQTVTYKVPGPLWNKTFGLPEGGALEFEFPDVNSPATTGIDPGDTRALSVGFRKIEFHVAGAEQGKPASGSDVSSR